MNKECIATAVELDLPILLWGPPGVGKSASVKQIGEALGYKVLVLPLQLMEPNDLLGYGIVESGRTKFCPPSWVDELNENTILFLDELSQVAPETQRAALRLIWDRAIGLKSYEFKIVGACNPPETDSLALELPNTIRTRVVHLDFEVENFEEQAGRWKLDLRWAKHIRRDDEQGWALVRAYLHVNPSETNRFEAGNNERTYPCPRTWEYAARIVGAVGVPREVRNKLLQGAIGSTANAFIKWLESLKLPGIREIISNQEVFNRLRYDEKWLVIENLPFYLRSKEATADELWEFAYGLTEELRVAAYRNLAAVIGVKQVPAKYMRDFEKLMRGVYWPNA